MSFYIFICTFIIEITQKKHTRTVQSFNKKGTKHVKFAADETLKIRINIHSRFGIVSVKIPFILAFYYCNV